MYKKRVSAFRVAPDYSLSRNYQISENIAVTLHLALPLDICNTAIYTVFVVLSAYIRGIRSTIHEHDFHADYEWAFVVSSLCLALIPIVEFL